MDIYNKISVGGFRHSARALSVFLAFSLQFYSYTAIPGSFLLQFYSCTAILTAVLQLDIRSYCSFTAISCALCRSSFPIVVFFRPFVFSVCLFRSSFPFVGSAPLFRSSFPFVTWTNVLRRANSDKRAPTNELRRTNFDKQTSTNEVRRTNFDERSSTKEGRREKEEGRIRNKS